MNKVKSGITILHNNATRSTFIADDLDEEVQSGTRENDQHIEWMGELDIKVTPDTGKPEMKLGEFLKLFSHNNIIRLHYKIKGGHQCVLESWDDTSMDWEVSRKQGKNRHYVDNKVLGLVGILYMKTPDVINIAIERLEKQPYIFEAAKEEGPFLESCEQVGYTPKTLKQLINEEPGITDHKGKSMTYWGGKK